jgi:16S rRNA processing protein RimM
VSDKVELLVGRVGRAHGIRGDLTIDVRTDEPDRRFSPGTVFSTRRGPLTVDSMKWHSSRLLVRFAEVTDRNAAESLRGTELRVEVDPDERPEDPE